MQKPHVLEVMLLISMAFFAALSGCAGNDGDNAPLDDVQDDTASVPATETAALKGTQTCQLTVLPRGPSEDGAQVFNERFTCTDIMSDLRVSGAEVLEVKTLYYERHSGIWTAVGTITNEDGSWQGNGTGVLRMEGNSPYNYGEMVYTGGGAYAGLTYRYLVAGSDEDLVMAGWIEPVGSSE